MGNKSTNNGDIVFGPPYAVFNLSKIGLRYFRIFINASSASRESLTSHFINHPNVGWIFNAEGWFNLAIGIWAKDNAEINDISEQIRNILTSKDKIVLQSELTSLYSFGDRKKVSKNYPMCIVDSTINPINLSPLEIDYIKLQALDSSIESTELQSLLNVDGKQLQQLRQRLNETGVVVGHQNRINYSGIYFKVFIDSLSRKNQNAADDLTKKLWIDDKCVYLEKANNKYDIEFELILKKKSDIKSYVEYFSDFKIAILTKNIYTNLYPVNKIANLKEIKETLLGQGGDVIDFRNSKLWYLNYAGAESYLDIYAGNKKYFETMEQGEIELFDDITKYLNQSKQTQKINILDIGSGDGLKGRIFIEKIGEKAVKAYYPIDIQPIELAATLRAHANGTYAKHPTLLDIENLSARFPLKVTPNEKQVYIFFGGTYGNFNHAIINNHLIPLLTHSSTLIISMPIVSAGKTEKQIIDSYYSRQYEDIAFGPLSQVGFKKNDFLKNNNRPNYIVHINIENKCLVSSFILNRKTEVFGRIYNKGSIFKMTTSWKPTLDEFKNELDKSFVVDKLYNNKEMAIAIITGTKRK